MVLAVLQIRFPLDEYFFKFNTWPGFLVSNIRSRGESNIFIKGRRCKRYERGPRPA